MCGFAGSFYFNNTNNAKQFLTWTKQCSKLLEHRGPDAEGFFVNDFLSITSRRLRIHDLNEKADQPFKDPQNKYLLAFNGSIFNYIEIRVELRKLGVIFTTESDTEVVMYAIAIWGEKALEKFDGMFSIVFYNKVENNIIIARDRLGIKPLYYF